MRGSKAFVDVRVFNPLANTYSRQSLKAIYSSAETAKRRKYNHRIINIEHGSFTPLGLIFSSFGGMGTEANRFYNRIAELLSVKRDVNIGEMKNWIRTQISFSLLKSTSLCIRGSRSHRLRKISGIGDTDVHLASSEVHYISDHSYYLFSSIYYLFVYIYLFIALTNSIYLLTYLYIYHVVST